MKAVGVDPDELLDLARANVELVVPAQRAGVDPPDYWEDAEDRWKKEAVAYEAGNLAVHLTVFAILEDEGTSERYEFGTVGRLWVGAEEEIQAAAREAAHAHALMLADDILEDDTIEDISADELKSMQLVVEVDPALRDQLARDLSPRQPPVPPKA